MSNLNLKDLWIPIEILTDTNLSDKEKHIYSIVMFLSKENSYLHKCSVTIDVKQSENQRIDIDNNSIRI